jgi:hypothetical protein
MAHTQVKKLYGRLADIKARIPDMTGGRRQVMKDEAASIVKQINKLKAESDYGTKD